jgi:hypothetical protein
MNDPELVALVVALSATIVHLSVVGLTLRLTEQRYGLAVFIGVAAAISVCCVVVFNEQLAIWHFAAFFGAGVALVTFLYGAVIKSLSLAMLSELDRASNKNLPSEELVRRVVAPAFAERAELLITMRAAERTEAVFALTAKGLTTASRIETVRRFLRIETLGLYGTNEPRVGS